VALEEHQRLTVEIQQEVLELLPLQQQAWLYQVVVVRLVLDMRRRLYQIFIYLAVRVVEHHSLKVRQERVRLLAVLLV
jgi:hypothetical protein